MDGSLAWIKDMCMEINDNISQQWQAVVQVNKYAIKSDLHCSAGNNFKRRQPHNARTHAVHSLHAHSMSVHAQTFSNQ